MEEVPTPIRLGKTAREEQKCPKEWHMHLQIGNLNITPFSRDNLVNFLESVGENRGFVGLVCERGGCRRVSLRGLGARQFKGKLCENQFIIICQIVCNLMEIIGEIIY